MTRKDFIFIADVIRSMPTHAPSLRAQRESCATAFADSLGATNPRFNRELFIQAATGIVPLNCTQSGLNVPGLRQSDGPCAIRPRFTP